MLIVLKYGGNAMAEPSAPDYLLDDVAARVRAGDRVVLVHGGGPQIDAALHERNIVTSRVDGLRITDAETLRITESVLCGTVNKSIVRNLLRRGVMAAGISGQDAWTIVAQMSASIDGVSLGLVGNVEEVRPALLQALLGAEIVPVVAPLGVTPDYAQVLNVNADSTAGAIAGSLLADAFVVVTNVSRVRRVASDSTTGIERLTASEALAYLADGTFDGGMRPKIKSALHALARGARRALIVDSGPGALARALAGEGTTIVSDL